jgi:predicted metalloendopeptidase
MMLTHTLLIFKRLCVQDFYMHVCGNWFDKAVVNETEPSKSSMGDNDKRNGKIIQEILSQEKPPEFKIGNTTLTDSEKQVELKIFQKVKLEYTTCLDEKSLEQRGKAPIYDLLQYIQKPLVSPLNLSQFVDIYVHLHTIAVPIFIALEPTSDVRNNPTNKIIQISQAPLSFPGHAYNDSQLISAYPRILADVFILLHGPTYMPFEKMKSMPPPPPGTPLPPPSPPGPPPPPAPAGSPISDWSTLANQIVELEKQLLKIKLTAEEMADPKAQNNPVPAEQLIKKFPGFPWIKLLHGIQKQYGFKSSRIKIVNVATPTYVEKLIPILQSISPEVINYYIWWRTVLSHVQLIDINSLGEPGKVLRLITAGIPPPIKLPREISCRPLLNSMATARWFIAKEFSARSKSVAFSMVTRIKKRLTTRLEKVDWLDEATRKIALEKATKMTMKIGYPETIKNLTEINRDYSNITLTQGDYFGNVIKRKQSDITRAWKELDIPIDSHDWPLVAHTVNAFYMPPKNEMVIFLSYHFSFNSNVVFNNLLTKIFCILYVILNHLAILLGIPCRYSASTLFS